MKNILIAVSISIALFFIFNSFVLKKEHKYDTKIARISGKELTLEIADTPTKRAKGLMNRKTLEENSGMLFIFPTNGTHLFWMANTLIPLDMIWLDESYKIVYIEHSAPPCTQTGNLRSMCTAYGPKTQARYVIEVNGGWAKNNNLKISDVIELN